MNSIRFTKAQGAGNDFLIVEGSVDLLPTPESKQLFCDRRYGAGGDGVIFLTVPGITTDVDASLRIFNSDGSEAEISGNGTRCVAAYLLHASGRDRDLTVQTVAGVKKLKLTAHKGTEFTFDMHMGKPIFDAHSIPFRPPQSVGEPVIGYELPLSGGPRKATITSMGNPHCSIAVDNFEWNWLDCGREIERHPYFPNRTNIEFYRPVSKHAIEVRYWERGVGETNSSGTGSSAAAVAAILNGHAESPVEVRTLAGALPVRWEADGVYLTGPAEIIFQGEYLI
ncbi:MAG: diaminopimelate epimerase [Acidobacteria bacterium]|nr:diaminopimelate epimerase [Acidobacteriota bacterium]